MTWFDRLVPVQIFVGIYILLFCLARLAAFFRRNRINDQEWFEPLIGFTGVISLVCYTIPGGWYCLATGNCPMDTAVVCSNYLLVSLYLLVKTLENVFKVLTSLLRKAFG
jgi:hypothetical protein